MNYIRGITFAPFVRRGVLDKEEARESLKAMRERTGADTVLLAPGGLQKTAHSTDIVYESEYTMGDRELKELDLALEGPELFSDFDKMVIARGISPQNRGLPWR